jgi:hypothetical protein
MNRLARAAAATASFALLSPLAATLAAQKPIVYAPGSARYHIISVVTRSQEMGGQKAEIKITNEQQLSVKLAEHGKDTLDFAYTVDSSDVVSEPPITLPDVSKLVGTSVTGLMSRHGKVYELTSNAADSDANAKNLVEGMRSFLLALPEDAAVGSSWTDTTINSISGQAGNLAMSTITTSTVVGDTTFHGHKAWRVQRSSILEIQGKQSQAGQELQVEGSGTGNGTHYLGVDGKYLGSSATQRMSMQITIPSTGQTVPVTQAVTSKVEMVR